MGKFFKITLLVVALVLVRFFAEILFYDPFIVYFKHFLTDATLPNFEIMKLVISIFFRYSLNAILSIALLYVVFESKTIVKFSIFFYSIAFDVLLLIFVFLLFNLSEDMVKVFFYVRRFLIHPIFILLLLPAFYYQKLNTTK